MPNLNPVGTLHLENTNKTINPVDIVQIVSCIDKLTAEAKARNANTVSSTTPTPVAKDNIELLFHKLELALLFLGVTIISCLLGSASTRSAGFAVVPSWTNSKVWSIALNSTFPRIDAFFCILSFPPFVLLCVFSMSMRCDGPSRLWYNFVKLCLGLLLAVIVWSQCVMFILCTAQFVLRHYASMTFAVATHFLDPLCLIVFLWCLLLSDTMYVFDTVEVNSVSPPLLDPQLVGWLCLLCVDFCFACMDGKSPQWMKRLDRLNENYFTATN